MPLLFVGAKGLHIAARLVILCIPLQTDIDVVHQFALNLFEFHCSLQFSVDANSRRFMWPIFVLFNVKQI